MNWVLAVPSYKRADRLQKKTLTTLHDAKVPASRIYVFVVKDEEDVYKEALDPKLYNKIVVGELGIANQRRFITEYFPKGKLIVYVDDDINKFVKRVNDKKLSNIADLPAFINHAFSVMKKEKAHIWGINPTPNPYYMTPGYSTNLKYIAGGMYGIVNTKDPAYEVHYGDNQEDKERSIRYWIKDKIVIRFNDVSMKTTVYTPGGILAVQPDRIKRTKEATEKLAKEFPEYVVQVHKASRGIYDLKFRTGKVTGGAELRHYTEGKDDTSREVHSIRNPAKYKEARDELLEILRNTTLPGKLGKPGTGDVYNRARKLGSIGRTVTFGYGDTRHGIKDYAKNKEYPELFHALVKFGNQVVPKGWDYNGITLNEGVKANKHKDSKNLGVSYIIGIGDYTGGGIKVWDGDDQNPKVFDLHDKPVSFNGGLLFHQTTPFKGERYSMIFYRQMWKGQPKGVSMEGKGAEDEIETGGIFA